MPLYSLDDVLQPAIGRGEHWRLFERFVGSYLHAAIVKELQSHLDGDAINSPLVGSRILQKIRAPELLNGYSEEDTGGLFGMTLWNLVAQHPAEWLFYASLADPLDGVTGTVYFRPKD